MITVTFFLWSDPHCRRNHLWRYGAEHVNLLVAQVCRHLSLAHEFVLICDCLPSGLDARVRIVALDRTTFVPATRFAKLMLFRPDIGETVGKRVLYMDLDSVVVGSLDAIAGRNEDIVLWRHPRWRNHGRAARYNSSIILLNAGARPEVWHKFPSRNMYSLSKGLRSDDQEWIHYCLGDEEAYWDHNDGIYAIKLIPFGLPVNARFVTFPGAREPGQPEVQEKHPWIREHRWY